MASANMIERSVSGNHPPTIQRAIERGSGGQLKYGEGLMGRSGVKCHGLLPSIETLESLDCIGLTKSFGDSLYQLPLAQSVSYATVLVHQVGAYKTTTAVIVSLPIRKQYRYAQRSAQRASIYANKSRTV